MAVLFFVEPVVFRNNPDLLLPWVGWIEQIVIANPRLRFSVATSGWLCECIAARTSIETYPISAVQALAAVDFNRSRYGQTLYLSDSAKNAPLADRLREIADASHPDFVVSFTENPYLADAFPESGVLFSELGCVPRQGAPTTFFLDPCGHQRRSIMNVTWDRIARLEPPLSIETSEAIWQARRQKHIEAHPSYASVRGWIAGLNHEPVRLLVLQPPDWLSYEGLYERVTPEEIIYREAFARPDGILIPIFKRGHQPAPHMQAFITGEFPNVIFPPAEIATGMPELFLPHVGEVITISSTVGMAGVLEGNAVKTLGQCAFARAAEAMTVARQDAESSARLRRNLLSFLSNRYLYDHSRCLHEPGYYQSVLMALRVPDVIDQYFDFSCWDSRHLQHLFGLALDAG